MTLSFYVDASGEIGFAEGNPTSGWTNHQLGGHVEAGTSPSAIYNPSNGETFVYYHEPNTENFVSFWQWNPSNGWTNHQLGGHVASGTSPSAAWDLNTGEMLVAYHEPNAENFVSFWQWTPSAGWSNHQLGGHVASGTSPSAAWDVSSGEPLIAYHDANAENFVSFWQWTPATGWTNHQLGGHVASGTSPSAAWESDTGEPLIAYHDATEDFVSFWQWSPSTGWTDHQLGGDVASGTSPAAAWNATTGEPFVAYHEANTENFVSFWQWTPSTGWIKTQLGGHVANRTSPSALVEPDLLAVNYVDIGGAIAGWQWSSAPGWLNSEPAEAGARWAPVVETAEATSVSYASTGLNGAVDPNGEETVYQFEYGPTTSYGLTLPAPYAAAGSGTSTVAVGQTLTGLSSATTYHYRLVATNEGGTTHGADKTFTTTIAPPENSSRPTITGTPQQGQTLTASTGTWTNEPTSYTYQWQRCNSSGTECANISGATTKSHKPGAADVGRTLVVVVKATNAGGSASASSVATSQVKGLLVGDAKATYSVADQTSAGREEAFQFTAKSTGKVEELEFRTNATANTGITGVTLGIFAENGGVPGEVRGQAQVSGQPATRSWIKATGLSTAVVSGTKYWLVVLPLGESSKQLHFDVAVSSGGTGNVESIATGLSALTAEGSWETSNQGPVGFQAIGP
jgi:hypothetical protein